MEDQQEEYVEHQYMCSECQQLFNTLEEVLVHQQIHAVAEGDEAEAQHSLGDTELGDSQYQCLECGALLRSPEELLPHQELHMREAGLETEHGISAMAEMGSRTEQEEEAGPIQYQCLECLALFSTAELWMAHRYTHSKSSTHSTMSDTEYVLQADGSITPVVNVQNLVLDDQRAGEILNLAQALAREQSPTSSTRATTTPASATLQLQICSAQALADGSASTTVRRAKFLPPLLTPDPVRLENGMATVALPSSGLEEAGQQTEVLLLHPYECSECALLFTTPEDFLQHQGEHFLAQEKESGEGGVMVGYEDDERGIREEARDPMMEERGHERTRGVGRRVIATAPMSLQCGECQRTFTSANRLAAHRRVHEHGTHECPECDKVFKKAGSLQTHMRTHSGEARYLCVDCGRSFTTEMTLVIHRKSHTAEPLHRCPFCPKTFTNMTKFLYHRRTHIVRSPVAPISTVRTSTRPVLETPLTFLQRAREVVEMKKEEGILFTPFKEEQMEVPSDTEQPAAAMTPNAQVVMVTEESPAGTERNGLDASGATESNAHRTSNGDDAPKYPADPSTLPGTSDPRVAGESKEERPGAPVGAGGLAYPCTACKKVFTTQVRLVRHRRTAHINERRFKCGVCGKPFKKQIHVRNHLRTHTGERPFQCSVCGKTFSSLANLSRHGLTHTGIRPYRCDVCHKAFTQSSNLRQHRLLHSNPTPSACPDCPATFIRPAKLLAHRFLHHPGSPAPYPCPHCTRGFLRKRQRDLHCLEDHPSLPHPITGQAQEPVAVGTAGTNGQEAAGVTPGGEQQGKPSLDCAICGKRLNSTANLRLHQLLHGDGQGRPRGPSSSSSSSSGRGRSHPCGVCGKLFVSASSMSLHQRVHTGERPYPCGVCGKRFRQNTHLREHLRTHSGERPFRCEFCSKGFVQSMHLAEHRRTHTGEKPHTCADCGKAFRTISNLRNHRKIHARNQVAAETATAVAVVESNDVELATAVPALCQQGAVGQPQLIHIQASDLQQAQGTPTIMCNEFGETIAIIETSGDLAEAIELYHSALEGGLNMEAVTIDNQQLM